jgi:hypothetical protein
LSIVAIYAAYGSNMDPAQMAHRCPHSPQQGAGWLDGWRLTFGGEDLTWEGALTTVVEESGQRVFVVLYEVPDADEAALDRWAWLPVSCVLVPAIALLVLVLAR